MVYKVKNHVRVLKYMVHSLTTFQISPKIAEWDIVIRNYLPQGFGRITEMMPKMPKSAEFSTNFRLNNQRQSSMNLGYNLKNLEQLQG